MNSSLSPSTTPKGQDVSPQGGVVARGTVTFNHAQLGDDDAESYSARDGTTTNATENATVIGFLKAFMFDDLRHPKDTIIDTQRKIVVAWGLPLSLLPIAFLLYLLVEMTAASGPTAGTVVAATAMLLFVGAWIPINTLVRFRRRLPELMVDVWLFVTLIGLLTLSISLVEYPVAITSFFLAALVFLCDTPRKPFHLVGCALVYIIAVVNQAIAGLSRQADGSLSTLPGAYWSTTQERFVFQGSTLIIAAVVTASLQMQANERSRNALSEVAAARFARRVADQLICCNTDAAVEELRALRVQAYTEDGEYLKPALQPPSKQSEQTRRDDRQGAPRLGELVSPGISMTSMPENSRFATTVDSIDLSADSAQIQIGASARHTDVTTAAATPVAADAPVAANNAKKKEKEGEDDEPAILVSVDHRLIESFELLINHFEQFRPHLPSWLLSTAVHQGDRVAGAHLREATDADMVSIEESIVLSESNSASITPNRSPRQASYRTSASQQRTLGTLSLAAPPKSPLNQRLSTHSTGSNDGMSGHRGKACKIAVAWIDFTRAVAPDPAHPTVQDAVCALVDSVHEAADNTYASVHSFIGDSILASWNTGRNCANVESKAARFMAAVRDATLMHDGQSLHATGAVMTGDAFVQLAGHSGRQLALTAWFTPWRAALRQLAAFSRSCGGLLLDEGTSVASSFSVETRIVDYVTVSRTSSGYASNRASPSPSPLAPRFSFGVITSETPLSLHRPSQLHMPEIQTGCRTFPVFEVIRDTNYQNTRERRTMMSHAPSYLEQEWMYTVGNAEKASSAAMREALTQAQSGRFADARDLLEAALRKEAAQRTVSRSPQSNPSSFGTSHSEKDATPRAAAGAPAAGTTGKPVSAPPAAPRAQVATTGSGGGMRREHSDGQLPPLHTGSGVGSTGVGGGSAGSDGGVHLASATLPPSTPPLARRLLYKLETFAAMGDAACWATFPDDLTKYI